MKTLFNLFKRKFIQIFAKKFTFVSIYGTTYTYFKYNNEFVEIGNYWSSYTKEEVLNPEKIGARKAPDFYRIGCCYITFDQMEKIQKLFK